MKNLSVRVHICHVHMKNHNEEIFHFVSLLSMIPKPNLDSYLKNVNNGQLIELQLANWVATGNKNVPNGKGNY